MTCQHCEASLIKCHNETHAVCNATLPESEVESTGGLCKYCRLNQTIPSLEIDGHAEKWTRLEHAKRRVLRDLVRCGLPITHDEWPLKFDFLAATENQPVSTGHADGLITIDIAEADSVVRERNRVQFGEPQRTLVGHFRHELGHYHWQCMVQGDTLTAFRELFGDETDPSYGDAKDKYYRDGPQPDWPSRFVSAYASMHPWEDFAETFAMYFDLRALMATAHEFDRVKVRVKATDFDGMMDAIAEIGLAVNEMNRDLGLLDLIPEVFHEPVKEKLRFVHDMVLSAKRTK